MHHTLFEERVSIFIGANAILQFVGDVILEAMGLIPPRINHLSLTFLNAFISFKTLSAIQKDKFRFLHEDCQIFWLLELLLIVGDVYYSFKDDWGREFITIRLFFVVCSMFNWVFITYIILRYQLYHLTYQGHTDSENESFIYKEEESRDGRSNASPSPNAMTTQISMGDGELTTVDEKVMANTQNDNDEDDVVANEKADSAECVPIVEETESVDDSLSDKKMTEMAATHIRDQHKGDEHENATSSPQSADVLPTVKHSFTATHSEVP